MEEVLHVDAELRNHQVDYPVETLSLQAKVQEKCPVLALKVCTVTPALPEHFTIKQGDFTEAS